MNARTKTVTVWSVLCVAGVSAGLLALTERAAETQMSLLPPVQLASVSNKGTPPNGNSSGAVASGDGQCVAYYSDASDILPPGSPNLHGFTNVYAFDRNTLATTWVSIGLNGMAPNGPSQAQRFRPSIDSDCSCVAFSSDATNLVPNDTNGKTDVFVHGLPAGTAAGTTLLASIGLGGDPADGASSFPSVSGDCSRVAFQSLADNLVPNDTNNFSDIFVYDIGSGSTTRVSVGPGGTQANGPSITPSFSADGRCVAFASGATNLLPSSPDTNKTLDIYVECDGVVTCRASVSSSGEQANDLSFLPALNADGTIVAFKSNASNLVADDFNAEPDVFVHNCTSGETIRVSVGDEGQEGDSAAIPPSISGDGRFVAFGSFASNLIRGVNVGGNSEVYVRDLLKHTTTLISSNAKGQAGNGGVPDIPPSVSLDGDWVAFDSLATNLIPANTQGFLNAYIRANFSGETPTPTPTRTPTGPTATSTSSTPGGPTNTPTGNGTPGTPTPTGTGGTPGTPGTPTSTPTATQHISCHQDSDCPLGEVCGPDMLCVTAPTPTPVITCTDTSQCPGNLVCVNGVCRDLSTPTPTNTPLPTCTTDADCADGTVCRAGVCTPHLPCVTNDMCQSELGDRETCYNDFCECGGDCNLDGVVFGSEISDMVLLLGQPADASCPTADINHDGMVTGADVSLAVLNLGLGCPSEGTAPLIAAADRSSETRTLAVHDLAGSPGDFVHFDIDLQDGGDVTTAQVDIEYDETVLSNDATEAPFCNLDSRITDISSDFLGMSYELQNPTTQPPTPPGFGRMRVFVVDTSMPLQSFGPGPLFHCTARIAPGATPGTMSQLVYVQEIHYPEITDPNVSRFNAQVNGGAITVNQPIACPTPPAMCPDGTECIDGTCKPIVHCSGPTAGPTECLPPGMSRQACVDGTCVCVGDCMGEGLVTPQDVQLVISIFNGAPLDTCKSADFNGNGIVEPNEVQMTINNFNVGCP